MIARIVLLLAALTVAAGPARAADDAKPAAAPLRTWAVLLSDDLRVTPLADLVAAALKDEPGLTLVDRQHLDLLAGELAAANLAEGLSTGRRVRAGRILKADALAVLSRERVDGKEFARLTICECRAGARLYVSAVALKEDDVETAAARIAADIRQTRRRFAGGVRRVFGVPPFVSRNLTHEYDHLQRGYGSLLAAMLAEHGGVAVVEVEEARQIAREIALGGDDDVARTVPCFVEGEFEVQPAAGDAVPEVRLSLRTSGLATPEATTGMIPLGAAPEFLRLFAARLSGNGAAEAAPMTAAEQSRVLVERADAFASLGNLELAVALREAALLVKDDPVLRTILVKEYMNRVGVATTDLAFRALDRPAQEEEACRRLRAWYAGLAHLEYLVRNRQITCGAARDLALHMSFRATRFKIMGLEPAEAAGAEKAKKRFLRQVMPLLFELPQVPANAMYHWRTCYAEMVKVRIDPSRLTAEDLDLIADMMETSIPVTDYAIELFEFTAGQLKYPGFFTRNEYLAFLDRVAAMDRPADALFARYARLRLFYSERFDAGQPAADLVGPAEALLADLKSRPSVMEHSPWLKPKFTHLATEIRKGLAPGMGGATVPDLSGHPGDNMRTRVHFKALKIKVKTLAGETAPIHEANWPRPEHAYWKELRDLVACGDKFDVLWSSGAVVCRRQPELLEEWFVDEKAHFDSICWDGRHVWIATRHAGVWVVSPEGTVLARLGEAEHLPPCDARILLHPLEKGKVIAVAAFGADCRAWCATLQWDGTAAAVNVFHRATRFPLVTASMQGGADSTDAGADLAFHPAWLHEFDIDAGRQLLVGRIAQSAAARRPLAIDLETLKVSVSEFTLRTTVDTWPDVYARTGARCVYFSSQGRLLEHYGRHLVLRAGAGATLPNGKAYQGLFEQYDTGFGNYPRLLLWKGWIHAPGAPWVRIHSETLEVDVLTPRAFYKHPKVVYFGVSALGDLIGWTGEHEFYRVSVDEKR